jgi:hypothetical protein
LDVALNKAGPIKPRRAEDKMPSVEQCRAYAAEYKLLAKHAGNSARRSAVLMNISRSWTALANQHEILAVIVKSEGR